MPISPPPPKEKAPSFLLLVGNSGVGKSFIGNALVGDGVFASSHQVGSVTASAQSADMCDPQGKYWRVVDMPGLMEADSRNLQRNTQEITKAFNAASGQPVVVAFVLTLEGGRMRAEQIDTINTIQNNVRGLTPDNTIIIVNKVGDDEPEETVRGIIHSFFPNHKHVSVVNYLTDNVRRNLSHPAVRNGVAGVHAALKACTAATIQAQEVQAQTAEAERQRREKALQDGQGKAEQEAAERREVERLQKIRLDMERAEVQRQAELDRKMLQDEKANAERARVERANEAKRQVEEQMRGVRRQEEEQRQKAERERERQEEEKRQMRVRLQEAECEVRCKREREAAIRQAEQQQLRMQQQAQAVQREIQAQRERQEAAQRERREASQREVDYRRRENRNAGYNMDGSSDMRYSSNRVEGYNKDGSKDMRYKRNR